jgi:DNA invertase Pin-like site-specific DNA recombinase
MRGTALSRWSGSAGRDDWPWSTVLSVADVDSRREPQLNGIAKAKDRGVKFGRKRELTDDRVEEIRALREAGETVPAIIKRTGFSKASIYRALS